MKKRPPHLRTNDKRCNRSRFIQDGTIETLAQQLSQECTIEHTWESRERTGEDCMVKARVIEVLVYVEEYAGGEKAFL